MPLIFMHGVGLEHFNPTCLWQVGRRVGPRRLYNFSSPAEKKNASESHYPPLQWTLF